jgi:carboxypeptidase Q
MIPSPGRQVAVLGLLACLGASTAAANSWLDSYRDAARRIIAAATADDAAWQRLAVMTDTFGHRLSGSPQLEATLRWAAEEMKSDFDDVRLDPVMVPHWVRGAESLEIVEPHRNALVMLGLGGSVGTAPDGLMADLLVVRSFADLDANAARARGRIVLFNVPYTTYGETVQYRSAGPSRAAARGAVAALVRAVGPPGLRTPHTGGLRYATDQKQIPAAAISTEDADRLHRMQDRGTHVTLRLRMEAKVLPDAESANLVADYRGREKPDEIVAIGCHIDSWDVGAGAIDDGGGCLVMWEAVRVLKRLNLRPRRTIRVVLWTNEENGLRGGLAYRDRYRSALGNHVMMLESDSGVFRPLGFGFTGPERGRAAVADIASLLYEIGANRIGPSGGGADIGPSVEAGDIPAMSLDVDGSKYFLIHHTPADTVDKIDPLDMAKCVAAVAVMSYVVADMPERLDR